VYPNKGQSLAELAETAPDVVEEVVVVDNVGAGARLAGEVDLPPHALAASPTQPISIVRLTSLAAARCQAKIRRLARLIARRDAIEVQATLPSGCRHPVRRQCDAERPVEDEP
jgi:hypothetical protein